MNRQSGPHWGQIMDAPLKRRINVASCWASARIAVLDSKQRYEDSYAITQEFQEWISALGEDTKYLEQWILKVPSFSEGPSFDEASDTDEVIEI